MSQHLIFISMVLEHIQLRHIALGQLILFTFYVTDLR